MFSANKQISIILFWFLILSTPIVFADSVGMSEHVQVEIFSEVNSVKPGQPFTVAVRLIMHPGWHTYWRNAGDAGLPTNIEWNLPEGFTAGTIQWPYPKRIEILPLVDYGYEDEATLLCEITPPVIPAQAGIQSADPRVRRADRAVPDDQAANRRSVNRREGDMIIVAAKVDWLECKDICIPGSANIDLPLPVSDAMPARNEIRVRDFEWARAHMPLDANQYVHLNFNAIRTPNSDGKVTIRITSDSQAALLPVDKIEFFTYGENTVENAAPQIFRRVQERYELELTISALAKKPLERISGILVIEESWKDPNAKQAVEIDLPVQAPENDITPTVESLRGRQESPPEAISDRSAFESVRKTDSKTALDFAGLQNRGAEIASPLLGATARNDNRFSLWFALGFAFVGGLLLNLMPCVLPVLSIKILGFIKQAGENPLAVRIHGLLFGFGVLVSFWLLTLMLLVLRQSGKQFGWGFQLQSPSFVSMLICLFFLLALNLFGLFEWGGSFTRAGAVAAQTRGYLNSFLNGLLATIIATPCTAPFMGAALGFALSQPAWVSFLIFTSLALGMASPYILLSINPSFLRWIPKPGAWMVVFKRVMGIPLFATTAWLSWVLSLQVGKGILLVLPPALFFLGTAAWGLGQTISLNEKSRRSMQFVSYGLILLGFSWASVGAAWSEAVFFNTPRAQETEMFSAEGIVWEPFSQERLDALRGEGKPVFIDFTAAWCLTCQVNEKLAFSSKQVQEKFKWLDIQALKADWTRRDEAIGKAIAGYGRSGVPLYVYYAPRRPRGAADLSAQPALEQAAPGSEEPVILPELITAETILNVLDRNQKE